MLAELRRVATRLEVPRVAPPVPPARPLEEQDTLPAGPQPVPAAGAYPAAAPQRGGTRMMARPGEDEHLGAPGGPPAHLQARRRSRRIFAVWTAIVLVLALLVGVSAWWLGSGRWTAMPSVVGLDQNTAQQLLGESDLVASITTARDDNQPAGVVASADPQPDSRLLRGSTVVLTISSGRPTVPTIAPGTAVAAAEQALRDAGLTPVRTTDADQFNATVPAGAAVGTNPAAGTPLTIGAPVTLVLSRGPQPPPPPDPDEEQVRVPFVIGERFEDAADKLDDEGLDVEQNSRFSDKRDRARVINQDPSAGTLVDPGTTVTLDTF
jgi:serine/threonine-protein kinase